MIVFDLKCACGHVFEGWFASSAAFSEQQGMALIPCPLCGSTEVGKAVMAPRMSMGRTASGEGLGAETGKSGNEGADGHHDGHAVSEGGISRPAAAASVPTPQQVLIALARMQQQMLQRSTWVGERFAEEARAQASGDADAAPIHGRAEPEEIESLREDGIAVMPLIVPIVPPDQCH